jgi:hypothetical protein
VGPVVVVLVVLVPSASASAMTVSMDTLLASAGAGASAGAIGTGVVPISINAISGESGADADGNDTVDGLIAFLGGCTFPAVTAVSPTLALASSSPLM